MKFLNYIPSGYHYKHHSLYASEKYINLMDDEVRSFCMVNEKSRLVLGLIHFQIINNSAISLKNAPFGGFEFYADIDKSDLEQFIAYIIDNFRLDWVKKIVLKTPTLFYSQNKGTDQLVEINIFKPTLKEINHHLEVSNQTLIERLHSMEKRKYKKCLNANFTFRKESNEQLKTIYQFIKNCRREKSQDLSLSLEKLEEVIQVFPDLYHLFTVYDGSKLIAASICIEVNNDVLYNFYPASSLGYNNFSPMVFLVANIYHFAQEHKFKTLDLGTSMLDDKYNKSLVRFKENLGGIRSYREVLELEL